MSGRSNLEYYYANRDTMLEQQRSYYYANRVRILRRQMQRRRVRLAAEAAMRTLAEETPVFPSGSALKRGAISLRREAHSASKLVPPPRPLVRMVPVQRFSAEPYNDESDSLTEIVDVDDFWFELFNGVQ